MTLQIPEVSSETHQKKSTNWLWRAFSLAVGAGLVAIVIAAVDWQAFREILARLSLSSLLAAFGVYVLLNFFRSLRYISLLDRELPVSRVFAIALYHNFLVRLLPFKLGEFAYIVLMQRRLNVSLKEGVSSLFGARLLELLVIVLIAALSLMFAGDILPLQSNVVLVFGVLFVALGLSGFYFASNLLHFASKIIGSSTHPIITSLTEKLDVLAAEFKRLQEPRIFIRALLLSCLTYACSFGVNWILLYAANIRPDPVTLVILVSLGMFATAFPFNISGFGAVELSWAFGLTTLLGFSMGEAASIGLMLNGYQLICAAVSGMLGYLVIQVRGKPLMSGDDALN